MKIFLAPIMGLAIVLVATSLYAETKVTVSNVHLCCGACVKAVDKALADLEGVKGVSDAKAKTIAISATSDKAAQTAIDALAAAGFHGETDSETVKYKNNHGAVKGKVKRIEVTGVHNCCGACNVAIKKALGEVDGVQASTCKPKQSSFVVEGDFDALELVESLFDAGFHVSVKK